MRMPPLARVAAWCATLNTSQRGRAATPRPRCSRTAAGATTATSSGGITQNGQKSPPRSPRDRAAAAALGPRRPELGPTRRCRPVSPRVTRRAAPKVRHVSPSGRGLTCRARPHLPHPIARRARYRCRRRAARRSAIFSARPAGARHGCARCAWGPRRIHSALGDCLGPHRPLFPRSTSTSTIRRIARRCDTRRGSHRPRRSATLPRTSHSRSTERI